MRLKNSNDDETLKSYCDETQLKLRQNSNCEKLVGKNSKCDKTQIVTKL